MAKREKEVVEGEGRGGRSRTSSSGNLPFPRLFRPFKYLMDSGFYILHPRFYTELGCAMTLLDFIYVCTYMCIYVCVYVYIFVGVQASFYRCPFFDNRFIVKVAPRSIHRIGWKVLSVSQFRYSEFFFFGDESF